ncbi:hypothetical protein WMY93_012649 [Mugilogobius chulae]|uniref:PINIT domain-containing protein n=1 Tax=Mugilogobius chulae TaxID=88201 RepID=A0AAW0NY21_9GOBI
MGFPLSCPLSCVFAADGDESARVGAAGAAGIRRSKQAWPKHELLTKALHLLKSGCSPAVHMKIKELYRRRFPAKMLSHTELSLSAQHHPAAAGGAALPGLTQLAYEGHGGAPSPAALLPLSLLGPGKHELSPLSQRLGSTGPLHPLHPDVKLQRLPFYDMLDELIKPTSLDVCTNTFSLALSITAS